MDGASNRQRTFDARKWREYEYLRIPEVMQILGIGRDKAQEIVCSLPHIHLGGMYRVASAELDRWIKAKEQESRQPRFKYGYKR